MGKQVDGHLPDFWDVVERHSKVTAAYLLTHTVSEIAEWMYIKPEDAEELKTMVHSRLAARRRETARSGVAWKRYQRMF